MTDKRTIRVEDELWDKAMKRANNEGVTLSELVRTWLDLYANEDQAMSLSTELARIIGRLSDIAKRITSKNITNLSRFEMGLPGESA